MSAMNELVCHDERRRQLVRQRRGNGLDFVEVSDDQLTLTVYFLAKAPPDVTEANVRIEGGRRVRGIRVTGVTMCRVEDPDLDDCMQVTVDRFGDFSTYRLCLVEPDEHRRPGDRPMAGLDPRYSCVEFSFKVGCPSSLDCAAEDECPPAAFPEPQLDYLAKDYASFRQLILDRLALIMPDWRERQAADVGIALVELLAYVGDYLSYHQDAVATEAYLETARLRPSVRRHARLVDYVMHEGCNARAWVCVETDADVTLPADVAFITSGADPAQARRPLTWAKLPGRPSGQQVFEPLVKQERSIWVAQNRIHLYTWGDRDCCLLRGATSATLLDRCLECPPTEAPATEAPATEAPATEAPATEAPATPAEGADQVAAAPPDGPAADSVLHLAEGDVLIFEEVLGPKTGDPADADPARRHAVRLTKVDPPSEDPVTGDSVVEVEWAAEDALPFPLCISTVGPPPDCELLENVTVARGNVLLVDHGWRVRGEVLGSVPAVSRLVPCADAACGEETIYSAGRFRPRLEEQPMTLRQAPPAGASAAALRPQDPRQARPQIDLSSIPLAPGGAVTLFDPADFQHPQGLVRRLLDPQDSVAQALRARLSQAARRLLDRHDPSGEPSTGLREALLDDLRRLRQSWVAVPDLLGSQPDDWHYVVEIDNEGRANLRFGDGELGRRPAANTTFMADYRVGNGPEGNVGAATILQVVFDRTVLHNDLRPRNPLPSWGGTPPEPLLDVKLRAPQAFRRELVRAVTADDYARLAERHPGVQRAAAVLRFTGSWTRVQVAVDPFGGTAGGRLLGEVRELLQPYRRILHDLAVVPAVHVPLRVGLFVCVLPSHLRGHVEAALRQVLGSRRLPDGRLGFFHPDNLTFGDDIRLSRLVAATQAVAGVESVEVTALHRLESPAARELEEGILRLGPLEVAQLDNDPNFPENGRLELTVEGGR
jgi:hypothetical protein